MCGTLSIPRRTCAAWRPSSRRWIYRTPRTASMTCWSWRATSVFAVRIGDIDVRERVLVVAEIGNNHEGDIGRARELITAAASAGAPAVKMQTFRTERFVSSADPARVEQLR